MLNGSSRKAKYMGVPLLAAMLVGISLLLAAGIGTVTRVVDGDTIVVSIDRRSEKVRLIGVDTPETVHPSKPVEYFGKEASVFTKRMVEGKQVRLEEDGPSVDCGRYGSR